MPKLVLFTFDYELFLGIKSGNVTDCLIEPTDKLVAAFKKYDLKAIFFIDTVYLKRLKEISEDHPLAKNDLDAIDEQLKRIIAEGHYIFPHIHPHWLDAQYLPEINEWSLANKRYYRFAALAKKMQDELFSQAVEYIRFISSTAVIDSYRAGGWCIQPFNDFKKQFEAYGIKQDWSVIPGRYQSSDAHEFDFRKAPADRTVYHFSDDICKEDPSGEFKEWTISSIEFTAFQKWIDFKVSGVLQRLHGMGRSKGSTVEVKIREEGDTLCKRGSQRITASFEGLNLYRVKKYIDAIKRSDYFQFISHPKMLSDHDFRMIGKLFSALKTVNAIETDFRKE